jgi:hypothetical protein
MPLQDLIAVLAEVALTPSGLKPDPTRLNLLLTIHHSCTQITPLQDLIAVLAEVALPPSGLKPDSSTRLTSSLTLTPAP